MITSNKDSLRFVVVIPTRYASTRFPGKPLALLGGKPVIQHVYERAKEVIDDVYIATDDERIFNFVKSFGGQVIMTSQQHQSGTDRINEAIKYIPGDFDVVINIQGDEPFIRREQIELLKSSFVNYPDTQIATLVKAFSEKDDFATLSNPNSPKVVIDENGFALYFSRSVIPYLRNEEASQWIVKHKFYKHIGMYAYQKDVLNKITQLEPAPLEKAESLEQLRWLSHGYKIRIQETEFETIGIDTPEDLVKAEKFLNLQYKP